MKYEFKGNSAPWAACDDEDNYETILVYSDEGIQPHICRTPEFSMDDEKATANANLITAAPDLLFAAIDFINKVDEGRANSTDSYSKFKKAVEKALGIVP